MRRALLLVAISAAAVAADLPQRFGALVEKAPAAVRGTAGIHVVDIATGATVYAYNENQLLLPASNMKLFTAALALSRLGPDYRFTTRLVRESSGSLALVGGGDPSLSGRRYPYDASAKPLPTLQAIQELADRAIAAGLRRVDGDIVGDDGRYPWSPYPESWTSDDMLHGYGAPVSALTFNDNVVTVTVRPGTVGGLAQVEVDPGFEYFAIDNRVSTTASGPGSVRVSRVPGARQLTLTGSMGARSSAISETLAVDDPALFAAYAMYEALVRRGIPVHGRPRARHNAEPDPAAVVLASRESLPLSELLRAALKVSQNLHTEIFLREAALVRSKQGTEEAGLREIRAMLAELKIDPAAWVSEDAAGLARNDEVTPRAVTQLLTAMATGEQRALWRNLLPIGGQDGTLSSRLCCMTEVAGIRAKTGSLSRAVALSGYAESASNGRLAFSILVNNFAAPAAEVRAWVDRLATALIE